MFVIEKACIQNFSLIITEDCNLDCRHCCRGKKCQRVMSKEVIDAALSQCVYIRNLCIAGGEPFLHIEPMIDIINAIIDNKIIVDQISIVINGTVYNLDFLTLLYKIRKRLRDNIVIGISRDKYHEEEIIKRGLTETYHENVTKLLKTPFIVGTKELPRRIKLFNEGNAVFLDSKLTVDLKPIEYAMTYIGNNKHKLDLNGYCYIGPIVSISVDGYITECDASFENQRTKFNYGNVLTDSIVEVIKNRTPICNPLIYSLKVKKIAYDFHHYNK